MTVVVVSQSERNYVDSGCNFRIFSRSMFGVVVVQGVTGFEDFRSHIKKGNEGTKETAAIFQEM